jgi:hypothetical protein
MGKKPSNTAAAEADSTPVSDDDDLVEISLEVHSRLFLLRSMLGISSVQKRHRLSQATSCSPSTANGRSGQHWYFYETGQVRSFDLMCRKGSGAGVAAQGVQGQVLPRLSQRTVCHHDICLQI